MSLKYFCQSEIDKRLFAGAAALPNFNIKMLMIKRPCMPQSMLIKPSREERWRKWIYLYFSSCFNPNTIVWADETRIRFSYRSNTTVADTPTRDERSQGINTKGIDLVILLYSGFSTRNLNRNCADTLTFLVVVDQQAFLSAQAKIAQFNQCSTVLENA